MGSSVCGKYRGMLLRRVPIHGHFRMQARVILLGQVEFAWHMHQPDCLLPMERRREHAHRSFHPMPYFSHGMALEDWN